MWIDRFLDFTGVSDVCDLTIADAQNYLFILNEQKNYADRTFNQAMYAVRTFYESVLMIPVTKKTAP